MPDMFHGLYSVSQALRNFQRALDVTGHNVANVNTPGYSRQRVELQQNQPLDLWAGRRLSLGAGASINSINRIRDLFLDRRGRDVAGDLSKFRTIAQGLSNVESIVGEPSETGISSALDRFFNSWSGLGARPFDDAARTEVRLSSQLLADRIRNGYARMEQSQATLGDRIGATLTQIDDLAGAISELNDAIRAQSAGGGPAPDLRDRRDLLVADLSKLVDVSVYENPDGAYQIYAGEHLLVDSAGARPIPKSYNATAGTLSDGARNYAVSSGELAGLMRTSASIGTFQTRLDTLADALRAEINPTHMAGIDANGNTGIPFFDDTSTGAIAFDLSAQVKADPKAIVAGTSGDPGDGGVALLFAELREKGVASLGGESLNGYHLGSVGLIASEAAYFDDAAKTREAIMQQVENQIQAVSGVNLDEEMANMMRYQRSYQAAARTLTVIDQMTEDLINMLRR